MNGIGKIAVIGDEGSVELFAAAGADTFPTSNEADTLRTLKSLVAKNYAVIYITENVAVFVEKQLGELKKVPFPVVIPITSASGGNGFGLKNIKRNVEKAIGADILSDSV